MKKILVLGGNGFIGMNVCQVLNAKHKVIPADRKSGCDMMNVSQIYYTIKKTKPDIIINCAAKVGGLSYLDSHAAEIISVNTQMYLNLYQAIRDAKREALVINVISNCSYPGKADIQYERKWWDGELHRSVVSYAMTKKFSYVLSRCYERQYGINTMNLIFPNAYGEGDHLDPERTHAMSGMIMRMIKAQNNNEKEFYIWGDGSPVREWIYANDVGRFMNYVVSNGFYDIPNPLNIGKKKGISIGDSAIIIKDILGYEGEIKFDLKYPVGAPVKILDNSLFERYCPDFVFTDYRQGLTNTINYYKTILK